MGPRPGSRRSPDGTIKTKAALKDSARIPQAARVHNRRPDRKALPPAIMAKDIPVWDHRSPSRTVQEAAEGPRPDVRTIYQTARRGLEGLILAAVCTLLRGDREP